MCSEYTLVPEGPDTAVKCQRSFLLISTHVHDDARDEDFITNHKLHTLDVRI